MKNEKNKKILYELFKKGRIQNTELAKKVGISKETATYRLNKLEKTNILKKIVPIINYSALGLQIYRVQFKLKTKEKKEEFKQYLKGVKGISWLVSITGDWDVAVLFLYKNHIEFKHRLDEILNDKGHMVKNKLISIVTSITHLSPNYLIGGDKIIYITEDSTKINNLSDNEKKIIIELMKDGRQSVLKIAEKLKISATAITYNLKELRKKNIIMAFKPIINIELLGYEHFKVMIQLYDPSKKKIVRETLKNSPNVVYITEALGIFDIEFEAEFEKNKELLELIEKIEDKALINKFDIIYENKEELINQFPE
ncbi:MAG: Lrp/AsnC family transcriptional regulator [Nanobdellota archaeon]